MKYLIFAFALALVSTTTADAQSVSCSSSERFGNVLVRVGDSERRVIEAGPDRTVRLETAQGGAAGYRFDFYKTGRTVQVYAQAGIVTRVCRIRELDLNSA
ncbi:MAG: hypothetical protein RQ741_02340 [Wenzhouxiangellaceae bacterium]|nr:hypothetical protein [Wenzhouxiangellaceae bacterium]